MRKRPAVLLLLSVIVVWLAGCGQRHNIDNESVQPVFQDVYADTVLGSVYGTTDQTLYPKNPLGKAGGERPLPPLGSE